MPKESITSRGSSVLILLTYSGYLSPTILPHVKQRTGTSTA